MITESLRHPYLMLVLGTATGVGMHFLLGDGRRCSITVMGTLLEEIRGARALGTCALDGRAGVSVLAGSRPIVMSGILHDALTR